MQRNSNIHINTKHPFNKMLLFRFAIIIVVVALNSVSDLSEKSLNKLYFDYICILTREEEKQMESFYHNNNSKKQKERVKIKFACQLGTKVHDLYCLNVIYMYVEYASLNSPIQFH